MSTRFHTVASRTYGRRHSEEDDSCCYLEVVILRPKTTVCTLHAAASRILEGCDERMVAEIKPRMLLYTMDTFFDAVS